MHAFVSKAVFPLLALAWVSGAQAATVAGTANRLATGRVT